MRLRYRRRLDLLISALDEVRPRLLPAISAGLQALVRLPSGGPTESELIELAAAEGLALEGLGQHWHGDERDMQGLIIGFSRPVRTGLPGRDIAARAGAPPRARPPSLATVHSGQLTLASTLRRVGPR